MSFHKTFRVSWYFFFFAISLSFSFLNSVVYFLMQCHFSIFILTDFMNVQMNECMCLLCNEFHCHFFLACSIFANIFKTFFLLLFFVFILNSGCVSVPCVYSNFAYTTFAEASNQNSKSATIEMYAPSSYNDTVTGETLSSVSEKSDSYSNEGSQPDYMVSKYFLTFLVCFFWFQWRSIDSRTDRKRIETNHIDN